MQIVTPDPRAPTEVTRSLRRAIGLLRLLANHGRVGWRLSDLAQHTNLDPATVHRLLGSLCDEGLATRVAGSRRYALGPLAFELGLAAAPYFDLGRLTHDRLAALARELRATLYLKLRSGAESVCLARHDGVQLVPALMLNVGGRRPLCLTAGGVAMLLTLPHAQQSDIEARNRRIIEAQGATRWSSVQRMLARSRRCGFALNLGDIAAGISAIGVPASATGNGSLASITLAIAGRQLTEAQAHTLAQRLRLEAQALEPLLAQLRH